MLRVAIFFTLLFISSANAQAVPPYSCTSTVCIPWAQITDGTGSPLGVTSAPFFIGFGTGVTLPAYASTPTFNLGTLNGAATATNQTAGNASLVSILSALGSPFQAGGSIANTSFGATQGNAGSNAQAWWTRLGDGTNGPAAIATAGADGVSNTLSGLQTYARQQCWNGTTWDRCTQVVTGAAGSPNTTTVISVQGQPTMAPLLVYPTTSATGGSTPTGNIAANNTTAVVVKASAATLYGVQLYGIGSAPAYLKIYNASSATCGSGTPVKRLMIPAAGTAANGAGNNITFGPAGVAFTTGITYCVTTGIGDSDTTAPAASTFLVNIDWK